MQLKINPNFSLGFWGASGSLSCSRISLSRFAEICKIPIELQRVRSVTDIIEHSTAFPLCLAFVGRLWQCSLFLTGILSPNLPSTLCSNVHALKSPSTDSIFLSTTFYFSKYSINSNVTVYSWVGLLLLVSLCSKVISKSTTVLFIILFTLISPS